MVIPLANEEQTIDELLRRTLAQLTDADRVFCVIDNASRDGTRSRIERMSDADPRVTCVWAPENRCVVDAYFRGYREALEAGSRWVLEMDGGLSHLPEQIPQFVAAMEAGFDYAAGSRFKKGGRFKGKLSRWAVSRGGTFLSNLLLGTRMKDMCSGFECFTHAALSHVVEQGVRSRANFFQTEIRFMLRDWNWTEVPITYIGPPKAVSNATVSEALRTLWALRAESKASAAASSGMRSAAGSEEVCART